MAKQITYPTFEVGTRVSAETTYYRFTGTVVSKCYFSPIINLPTYLVRSDVDGVERAVMALSMKPVEDYKPPMSDLGQSLFDMMAGIGEAQAMQAEINAFFARRD